MKGKKSHDMMMEKTLTEFTEVLSSSAPTPGGGGASAAVGAFASSLGMMVANLTIGKKKYAEVEMLVREAAAKLEAIRHRLLELIDEDAKAFEPLAAAYKLPKVTQEQRERKEYIMEEALYEASIVPLEMMQKILESMELLGIMGENGSRLAVSDVGVGILFAQAALEGASLNVFINTDLMKNRERAEELNRNASLLISEGKEQKERIYRAVLKELHVTGISE